MDLPQTWHDAPPAWADHPAWPRIRRTITMLHLGSLAFVLMAGAAIAWATFVYMDHGFRFNELAIYLFATLLGLGGLVSCVADMVVVRGLRERRPWAWTGAMVLFALDSTTLLFLPMTIIGFISLGEAPARDAFLADNPTRTP